VIAHITIHYALVLEYEYKYEYKYKEGIDFSGSQMLSSQFGIFYTNRKLCVVAVNVIDFLMFFG